MVKTNTRIGGIYHNLSNIFQHKLVLMMGALHVEDKVHLMIGKLLLDSRWTTVLSQAQVLTSGRAQSALNEHHSNRTRYAHQVSLMYLHILKQRAYSNVDGPPLSQGMWDQLSRTENPQFKFWSTIMEFELLLCRFIRSLREGYFLLYVQVCDELGPWFHVMDHTNYARWLPVLSEKHPDVYAEFLKGNFVVQSHYTSSASLERTNRMNSPIRVSRHMAERLVSMRILKHSHSLC